MKSFQELKKNCKKDLSAYPSVKLAVLGDCATQMLAKALRGYGAEVLLDLQVFDADYNQIDAQAMDPSSELYAFQPDAVLIQMCSEKLYEEFCETAPEHRTLFASRTMEHVEHLWQLISRHGHARILQFDFVPLRDNVFGSYGSTAASSFWYQQHQLNLMLMEAAIRFGNVSILPLSAVQAHMGRDAFCDNRLYYSAKMPLSFQALPEAAKLAVDVVLAQRGSFKKCVVLDLDNTLWGGVIGDDGMAGIQLGELGTGHAFTDLQRWLRELQRRGVVLAVCSKNNEEIAREPFLSHPDMVLRMEDISMFVANWEDKASNIRLIQQTLNLGMDSLVFLDDNPFERNMVRSLIPEITVPELPEDPAQVLSYLQSLNLFETASFSEEDRHRTRQYQAEIGRATLQKQFDSLEDYLASLEMIAEAQPFSEFYFPRIAQLTQRSNQFNFRTIRYAEDDIRRIAADDRYITLYFTLRDRFGDHGLIGVVILEKQRDALFIETWLMSCRVLKRGMEEFMMNKIIQTAAANGFAKVIGEYIRTPKNSMVSELYPQLGLTPAGEHRYIADVAAFSFHPTHIKEM